MSEKTAGQQKVGKVVMVRDGWHRGVKFALFTMLFCIALSAVTILLFDYYFLPGLLLVAVVLYIQTACELKVELTREEVEHIIKGNKYTCYKNGSWGIGSIPYVLSDTFIIVSDDAGVHLEGGRAILKRVAKTLGKAQQ